ncbi:outer membrane protein [Paenirhodobacter sp.]|uniref:outer membrane protein n=1 Tax=Paenirhodobacter sp. TaxID=1965326 RepID=UPI003B50DF7F
MVSLMRKAAQFAILSLPALIGATAVCAGGYGATPVEAPVAAPVVAAAPVVDWSGGYAGVALGYAFGADDRVGLSENGGPVASTGENLKLNGFDGALRGGYRWQADRWVFGPELSIEGGDISDSFGTDFAGDPLSGETKLKYMAALRLKSGYLLNDQTLIYGMAGVAQAKFDYDVSSGAGWAVDDSFSRTGYLLGLGIERRLTESLSLTGEYEYANFGKETLDGSAGMSTEATPKFSKVRVGVNFNF